MKPVMLLLSVLLIGGCATRTVHEEIQDILPAMSDNEYENAIERNTQTYKGYSGLYNTFEVHVTLLNSKVREAILQRKGHFRRWDRKKAQEEREKSMQEMATKTTFMVALFTPEKERNDLDLGASIWKIFEKVNGTTYTGKTRKSFLKISEIRDQFPYVTRFHKVYEVQFDVPTSVTEGQDSVFSMTSSVGETDLTFKPAQ